MATLNTLRTRFGVVLSAVIAFALLAFIFSLKSEMGFSGNDPVVAEINGQDITYSEYLNEYNEVQRLNGVSEIDEQQAEMLYAATWRALLSKRAFLPGVEQMGIEISDAELMAMIRGEVPTQVLYNVFGDPSTGVYNVNALNNFLFSSQGNPEAEAMWALLKEQAQIERASVKYATLASLGMNINALEVEAGLEAANKSFSGRFASKNYADIEDSLVSISEAEIKAYYEENKEMFKRQPSRAISYVEFALSPSAADLAVAERSAKDLGERFAQASDIRTFLRESRGGSVASNFVSAAALPSSSRDALVAGRQYGPESDGATWSMSRGESSILAPDTLSISHIVLSYTDENVADSLLVALRKGNDADFATAAATYSLFQESAQNGGDIGSMPFSAFTDEFAAALAPLRKGEITKVVAGDMIQLIKVTDVGSRVRHYRVATIDVPIVASQETRNATYNSAGVFAVEAKGDVSKFRDAAADSKASVHNATITSAMRTVPAVAGSQELTRWAHRAKVGDLSEIFKVDDGYVVAMLTSIESEEYSPLAAVRERVERALMNEKKFEMLSSKISGSTFDAKAASLGGTTGEFENANFGSFYIAGLGVEPRVIGAIATSKEGVASEAIQGMNGIFIYVVDEVTEAAEPQSKEAEKLRAEVMSQQMMQQMLFAAVESMADVKDLRGENL